MLRKQIWYELVNVKYREIYSSKYLGLQQGIKKILSIVSLLTSLTGLFVWRYFEDYTWIAFIFIAIIQIISGIDNKFIYSSEDIRNALNLKTMYTAYFNKLNKLWTKYDCHKINDDEALEIHFKLRETDLEKTESLASKLSIKRLKRLKRSTEIETKHYINKYYLNG